MTPGNKIGIVFLLVVLLVALFALFRGYLDFGLFEVKQAEWSPPPPHVAVVAERSGPVSSDVYFVLVGDHVFSATELKRAYHSHDVIFAALSSDCLSVGWTGSHHLIINCRNDIIDSAHIKVRKPRADDIEITYVNIANSTAH